MTAPIRQRVVVASALAVLLQVGAVAAQTTSAVAGDDPAWWLAAGLGAGALSPDRSLADYRWDTAPTALYAAQAVAGRGRWALGVRLSRWATTQGTGLGAGVADPRVRLTGIDAIGQVRLATVAGCALWGSVLAGRIGLRYAPDRVTVPTGTPGEDLAVDYAPLDETNLGFGLEIRRDLGRRLSASLLGERSGFHLDTQHRRGDEIVTERRHFVNWSLRLQVAWALDLG